MSWNDLEQKNLMVKLGGLAGASLSLITSFLTATTWIYIIEAGITTAAGTRLAPPDSAPIHHHVLTLQH